MKFFLLCIIFLFVLNDYKKLKKEKLFYYILMICNIFMIMFSDHFESIAKYILGDLWVLDKVYVYI